VPETGDRDFSAPLFLCVGAAGWRKNIGHTLSVFASINQRIPRSRLLMVGVGSAGIDAFAPEGLNRATVETVASASMSQMSDYFRRCPFLLTTSWYEGGHALAVLEAMACGCIVFARAIPSIAEIIHDRNNGVLLPCDDSVSDAAIILAALNDPADLGRMAAIARHSAWRNRWARQGLRMNRWILQLTKTNGTVG
jgi:glycosyltransferase involved in cell wall biosynthesis